MYMGICQLTIVTNIYHVISKYPPNSYTMMMYYLTVPPILSELLTVSVCYETFCTWSHPSVKNVKPPLLYSL